MQNEYIGEPFFLSPSFFSGRESSVGPGNSLGRDHQKGWWHPASTFFFFFLSTILYVYFFFLFSSSYSSCCCYVALLVFYSFLCMSFLFSGIDHRFFSLIFHPNCYLFSTRKIRSASRNMYGIVPQCSVRAHPLISLVLSYKFIQKGRPLSPKKNPIVWFNCINK